MKSIHLTTRQNELIAITICISAISIILKSVICCIQTYLSYIVMYVGFLFLVSGILVMKLDNTTISNEQPTMLVMNGPFNYTRNPVYLGMLMICAGTALGHCNIISIAACIGLFMYFDQIIIPLEESLLIEKFGEQFMVYSKAISRWI